MQWRAGLWVLGLLNACGAVAPSAVPQKEPSIAPRQPRSTTDSSLLRFDISVEAGSGQSQAALRISLENVSTEWLKVRRNLGVACRGMSNPSVRLEMTRVSDGSEPAIACSVRRCGGRDKPTEFIELAPGDQFSHRTELGCDYAPPDEGPWRIVAHYQDESEGPPVEERYVHWTWFNGRLDSDPVEITVRPFREVRDDWLEELRRRQREEEEERRKPQ